MRTAPVLVPVGQIPVRLLAGLLAVVLGGILARVLVGPGGGGWQALAFALAPDVALFAGIAPGLARGQLHPRAVPLYNALHHPAGPLLLGAAALLWFGTPWLAAALAWGIHIAFDRAAGYGPRTKEGFQRG